MFPISSNRDLNIVAFVTKGEEEIADVKESWTSICERREVEDDYAGFDKHVHELISLMPEQPSKWRINDRKPLDRWHYFSGKVILLGDAAHAMTVSCSTDFEVVLHPPCFATVCGSVC